MFTAIPQESTSAKKPPASAFKTLIFSLLESKGDFSKLSTKIQRSILKCQVKQAYPKFLISDGTFFMQAYFTKDCVNKCRAKDSSLINITDLQEGLIHITRWELELIEANSAEEYVSYQGIEMRLIVKDFNVQFDNKVQTTKYPGNLFRDDEVKTHIQAYIRGEKLAHLNTAKLFAKEDPFVP
jgi:hypothetical protein